MCYIRFIIEALENQGGGRNFFQLNEKLLKLHGEGDNRPRP